MPFKKGNKHGQGRPEGSQNEKTKEWEQLGEFLTQTGAQRAAKIMAKSNDKQFMQYYSYLLEHFKPKLQRTELKGEITKKVINVKFRDNSELPASRN